LRSDSALAQEHCRASAQGGAYHGAQGSSAGLGNGGCPRAEQLIWNLARRLDKEWPGIAATILQGLDEILCVVRLGLPKDLRRSLACTNIIENMNGTIRQVTHNVKRWRDASMTLHWTAAGMMEVRKGFRRLKAYQATADAQSGPADSSSGALGTRHQ